MVLLVHLLLSTHVGEFSLTGGLDPISTCNPHHNYYLHMYTHSMVVYTGIRHKLHVGDEQEQFKPKFETF